MKHNPIFIDKNPRISEGAPRVHRGNSQEFWHIKRFMIRFFLSRTQIFNIKGLGLMGFALLLGGDLYATSLWLKATTNERGLFADRVASKVGDILTVTLNEKTTMTYDLKTETSKKPVITDSITQFLFPATTNTAKGSSFGTHNGNLPQFSVTGSNEYDTEGTIANSSELTDAITTVTVIDLLPNGNLVIEGSRVVSYSGETEYALLRGVVRPYDIAEDNTIESTKIADAQIEFVKEGEVTASQRKGWLLRFHDFINPF